MVEITTLITILMVMPVIPRPANAPPLFGGKTVILFGGIDKEAMRRWQKRARAAKNGSAEPPDESGLKNGPSRDNAAE